MTAIRHSADSDRRDRNALSNRLAMVFAVVLCVAAIVLIVIGSSFM